MENVLSVVRSSSPPCTRPPARQALALTLAVATLAAAALGWPGRASAQGEHQPPQETQPPPQAQGQPAVILRPPIVNFGAENLGHTSGDQIIRVSSTGTAPLKVGSITITPASGKAFKITKALATNYLAQGQTGEVSVAFTAQVKGSQFATLVVTSNAPTSPDTVALIATGVEPPSKPPGQVSIPGTPIVGPPPPKLMAPGAVPPADIALVKTIFQPSQAVWYEKKEEIDTNYLKRKNEVEWSVMPPGALVAGRDTLLFGVDDPALGGAGHKVIRLVVSNSFPVTKPVGVLFSILGGPVSTPVSGASGVGPEVYFTTRDARGMKIELPPNKETVVDLAAPVGGGSGGFYPFRFDASSGPYRIQVEIVNPDKSKIMDANPENQKGGMWVDVKATRGLSIHFTAVREKKPTDTPASVDQEERALVDSEFNLASGTYPFLNGTYPVAEGGISGDAGIGLVTWEPEESTLGQLVSAFNSDNQIGAFAQLDLASLTAKLAPIGWGSVPECDRVVGVLGAESYIWRALGAKGVHFDKTPNVVLVKQGANATDVAHELAHTLPNGWEPEEYHNDRPKLAKANGYWVDGAPHSQSRAWRDGKHGIMGAVLALRDNDPLNSVDNHWIEQHTFFSLLEQLSGEKKDPLVLGVRGWISAGGEVKLYPWALQDGVADLEPGSPGGYHIEILGPNGSRLGEFGFDLSFRDIETGRPLPVEPFAFRIPWDERAARVQLRAPGGALLAERLVSATPPSVRLTYPIGGERLPLGRPLPIVWQAASPEGNALSYTVMYSPDDGQSWMPFDTDLDQPRCELHTTFLPKGGMYRIKVVATDGIRTSEAVSGPFALVKAP